MALEIEYLGDKILKYSETDFVATALVDDEVVSEQFSSLDAAKKWLHEVGFEDKENEVVDKSVPYMGSTAFRRALGYVETHNKDLYKELISIEYYEMKG
jgi:hypothetical protein